jgi:hypothetical protein
MYWLLLAVLLIFGSPFLIGRLLGRALRMKDVSIRIAIVLLMAFMGLTPFAAQWVLGMQEQQEYEAAISAWRQKQEERLSNSKITDEGLDKLRQRLPELQIVRGGEEGQMAPAPGGRAAAGPAFPGDPDFAPGAAPSGGTAPSNGGARPGDNSAPANGGAPAAPEAPNGN